MKKVFGFILLLLVVAFSYYVWYLYNKQAPSTIDQKASYTMVAADLFSDFDNNEQNANTKYLDKVLLVEGKVASISVIDTVELSVILESGSDMFGVSCSMLSSESEKVSKIKVGDAVKIKGYCSGMLMDVVLNRCVLIN